MKERQILDVLTQNPGEWVSRSEIAKKLGKNRLSQGDFEALATLTATGRIEAENRPDPRPVGFMMVYRYAEQDSD